ncbi:hypothetical protein O6H91_02G097900 [Diphasiastrum complanatum]|uniref:Uncharacterized protein n=2 Tax=Diphasiastrum complanatum TaxID=34168 RepID=A0ACC2EIP5_DIPCM|nr:hypothetical protein O6H91_02G097900 [Diphasiastrum complanatum]KAJ7566344.1 hypothetical protein O6H91_02G097900 [Diphasiastrum complanatum]
MGQSAANKNFTLHRVSYTDSDTDRAHEMFAALDSQIKCKKGFDAGSTHEHLNHETVISGSKDDFHVKTGDRPGNSQNSCPHICRYCQREFSSGRALGGHMRAHGSFQPDLSVPWNCNPDGVPDKQQVSSSGRQSSNLHSGCEMDGSSVYQDISPSLSLRQSRWKDFISVRSGSLNKIDNESQPKSTDDITPDTVDSEDEASVNVASQNLEMDNSDFFFENDKLLVKNKKPSYTLRRNPKPSKLFVDQEYAIEAVASAPESKEILSMPNGKGHACTECGKEFLSWKGLFGHMRCHPEREWRGIQRPIAIEIGRAEKGIASMQVSGSFRMKLASFQSTQRKQSDQSECTISIGQSLTETESETDSIEAAYIKGKFESNLQTWKTRKRSKRSRQMVRSLQAVTYEAAELEKPNITSHITPTDIKEERDMANCLVMLACAGKVSQGELAHVKKKRIASYQSIDLERKNLDEFKSKDDDLQFKSWGKHPNDKISFRPDINLRRKILREAIMTVHDENNEGDQLDANELEAVIVKFECTRCKRTFKSHQALGGHRASHKKVKGCSARSYSVTRALSIFEDELTEEELLRSVEDKRLTVINHYQQKQKSLDMAISKSSKTTIHQKRTNAHVCSICHQIFKSGQALGGHKRRHWGGVGASEASNFITKQQELFVKQEVHNRKTSEDIDLNLPAPLEDVDMLCFSDRPNIQQNFSRSYSVSDDTAIAAASDPLEPVLSQNMNHHSYQTRCTRE